MNTPEFPQHDPDNAGAPRAAVEWPAFPSVPLSPPADPPLAPPNTAEPPRAGRRPIRQRRRAAFATLALFGVLGGTAGGAGAGYVASRRTSPSATVAVPVSAARSAVAAGQLVGLSNSTGDVSELVSATLPSVVSISVTMPGGEGAGSGFVISADGDIATNAHVVADATSIQVHLADGSVATAKVLGVDRTDDLAVIHIDRAGLTPVTLGTSADLTVGVPVVAIGNALDLTGGPTATEGIVSALNRSIDTQGATPTGTRSEHLDHLIQTDAAINPGNSGGPLLTLDGKVVGINSAGSSDAQNIGFAIAVDTAKPIIAQLEAGKTITKAYLGVSTVAVDSTVAQQYGLAVDQGLLVGQVTNGSAAQAAGVRVGDVITSANGTALSDETSFGQIIQQVGAGKQLTLGINRGGQSLTVTATLTSAAA